jgi:hypothetical protein
MAEKQADGEHRGIRLEYRFDRLLAEKLAQAYEVLVPERRGTQVYGLKGLNDENGGNLRASILRPAKGEPYDRQPSDSASAIC